MELPDDLLMEFLVRLPAKSLIRFKSVCKAWQSVVSSDNFCHRHTLCRPRPQSSLLLQMWEGDPFYYFNGGKTIIPYNYNFNKGESFDTEIVQACNGLLLLETKYVKKKKAYDDGDLTNLPFTPDFDFTPNLYYHEDDEHGFTIITTHSVYNPTTRQSREISLPHLHGYPRVAALFLAFDPRISPFYKMVCIRSTKTRDPDSLCYTFHVEVYDSETRSWAVSLEAVTLTPFISFSDSIVHWNNCIYWRGYDDGYLCFDIANNEMKELHFPQTPHTGRGEKGYQHCPVLQESNGRLYHFELIWESCNDNKSVFSPYNAVESVAVWELEGNNEWLLKYCHTLGNGKCVIIRNLITLMVRSDGDGNGDETCCLLVSTEPGRIKSTEPGKIKSYNFVDKTYEDFFNVQRQVFKVRGFQFGEVLALV